MGTVQASLARTWSIIGWLRSVATKRTAGDRRAEMPREDASAAGGLQDCASGALGHPARQVCGVRLEHGRAEMMIVELGDGPREDTSSTLVMPLIGPLDRSQLTTPGILASGRRPPP